MKKTFFRIATLASVAFVFTACPYQSTVPVSEPTEPVNEALFGKWVAASDVEYDKPTYYSIEGLDANRYEVIEYQHYDHKYNKLKYIMHSSMVDGKMFMNVQEATGTDYFIHMIEIRTDEFTLWEVTNNIDEQFSSSVDLKDFIEKYMDLSFFFTIDERKFVRK